jgi:hypothetical protein
MAELKKKLKKLGTPPKADEIKNNLDEPEVAPSAPLQTSTTPLKRVDGRSLRKTGFTEQLNIKVPHGFKEELIALARAKKITYGQVLVNSVRFYKDNLDKK